MVTDPAAAARGMGKVHAASRRMPGRRSRSVVVRRRDPAIPKSGTSGVSPPPSTFVGRTVISSLPRQRGAAVPDARQRPGKVTHMLSTGFPTNLLTRASA